ncbi:MAG: hypothetical protein CMP10_11025 [Zetaproteobacteria bacterium]|nr:hypothetical protein [Pseudobdellovibrionaceae bacterium]
MSYILAIATLFLVSCSTLESSDSPFVNETQGLPGLSQEALLDLMENRNTEIYFKSMSQNYEDVCHDDIYAKWLFQKHLNKSSKRQSRRRFKGYSRRQQAKGRFYTETVLNGSEAPYFGGFPVVAKPRVEAWMNYFKAGKGRQIFLKWLIRNESKKDIVLPLLKKEGLPSELIFLAMIESGFNDTAYSKARATGTWQFMSSTARSYGLKVGYWQDERRDPVKSTLAAARYLKNLYRRFDDWYLAIASYNAGPGKIKRAIRKTGSRDFWVISQTRHIRSETKHYVPKMLAALIIASNPKKHGFNITAVPYDLIPETTVAATRPIKLRELAKKLEIPFKTLKSWNPELIKNITPPKRSIGYKSYPIRMPKLLAEKYDQIKDSLSHLQIKDVLMYKIRQGDTLGSIAKRHRVKVKQIMRANPKLNAKRLRIGKKITIPVPATISRKAG